MSEKKQIKLSEIRDALKEGKTRKEIKKEFGLVGEQAKAVFNHPSIKGLRVAKTSPATVDIIEDIPQEEWVSNKRKTAATTSNEENVGQATTVGQEPSAQIVDDIPASQPLTSTTTPVSAPATQEEPEVTENPGGMW